MMSFFLGGFVAPKQQQVNNCAAFGEIDVVPWPCVDFKLGNTAVNRFAIAKVAVLEGIETCRIRALPVMSFSLEGQAAKVAVRFIAFTELSYSFGYSRSRKTLFCVRAK